MKKEDKDLLLNDLCSRLPHGVKVQIKYYDVACKLLAISANGTIYAGTCGDMECLMESFIEDCKPYLLPMSSMTEEQKKEYNRWKHEVPVCHYEYGDVVEEVELYDSPESFEYLIENNFDYRGLIPMGLAIDATNKNIY